MTMRVANPLASVAVDGANVDLEYRLIEGPASGPLFVFLHEGLGSVAMWKDFPDRLCAAAGARGLVYSRPGYGTSTPRRDDERWPADYMHHQARVVLPALLATLGIDAAADPPWLFGHSDGGSIALIHAATFPSRVAGLVVLAPHLDVEQGGIDSIALAREAYLHGDLRDRLARHHADVDSAFWGWNDVWLSDDFRRFDIRALLPSITCPILAIQGHGDQYGSMAHIDGIAAVHPATALLKLDDCGHSPHRDQAAAVVDATVHFVAGHRLAPSSGAIVHIA
jgi:pimeloyl-ACP methyl ester carboxylesterase